MPTAGYKSESKGSKNRRLVQSALEDSRARIHGNAARAPCPVCEGERGKRDGKLALSINLTTTAYHCHRCKLSGYLDREAAELAGKAREFLSETKPSEQAINDLLTDWYQRTSWVRGGAMVSEPMRRVNPNIGELERSRNVNLERNDVVVFIGRMADEFGVVAVAFLVAGPGESTIPTTAGLYREGHREFSGILKGWVLRSFVEGVPKYQNCPLMLRAECFFNEAAVYRPTSEPLVVVEGCFDAVSRAPNGVAVLGSLSQWQRERLLLAPRPVLIVPDGDAWEAGRMDAMELAHYGQTAGFLRLPPGKDPDEFSNVEWKAMVREKAEWF